MIDSTRARLPSGLPAALTNSLASLWSEYAGVRPTDARTEIRANVITRQVAGVPPPRVQAGTR